MDSPDSSQLQLFLEGQFAQRPIALTIILGACWHVLHLIISIFLFGSQIIQDLMYRLILSGVSKKYQKFQPINLKCLAIVFDKENVKLTDEIMELLDWLCHIGVQNVILYDAEGILKKSVPAMKRGIKSNSIIFRDNDMVAVKTILDQNMLSVEVLSYSDNKEAIARAASYLYTETLTDNQLIGGIRISQHDEADVGRALKAVGCGGQSPDLLLVFGGARCHFGFPAWRLCYTEIVYIGPLKSLNYGAIIKAFYRFSITHQNYGA